jgi:hypothetical protein
MMILSVLTQPDVEEEIPLTPIGTHGPKTRTIETIMEEEEDLNLKGTLLNSLKAIEVRPWSSWSLSKGS